MNENTPHLRRKPCTRAVVHADRIVAFDDRGHQSVAAPGAAA